MKIDKKLAVIMLAGIVVASAFMVVAEAKPTPPPPPPPFTVPSFDTQFQWRGLPGNTYGSWSFFQPSYGTSTDYTLKKNELHTTIQFSPLVTNLKGGSAVYTYDKNTGLWIDHKTTASYNYAPNYGSYTVTNFFSGYVKFDCAPSATNFVHGVLYQWVYIFAPKSDSGVTALLPNAVWDTKVKAWLIGFSVYIDDNALQSYTIDSIGFPSPFPEPGPNYNPLHL